MRLLVASLRFLTVFLMIVAFLFTMSVVWGVVRRDRWKRIHRANRILTRFCRFGLWLLKVRVSPIGIENAPTGRNALYVGNHLSYLDVLVISSRVSVCFVTSKEIKSTPVLGQICQMAGCLFVERRNRMNIHNEVKEIAEGLQQGLSVAIFPEATSTNGEQILRFRRPLYVAAIDALTPVVPFCLNYRRVGGSPINRTSRDNVFWYGDMPFVPHLWALCRSGGVEVDLHFLAAVPISPEVDAALLAERTQGQVESVFQPVR
ncbi:MAG: lysophospholipid acyltransferase family protein [Bdellovibrionales bacterium]